MPESVDSVRAGYIMITHWNLRRRWWGGGGACIHLSSFKGGKICAPYLKALLLLKGRDFVYPHAKYFLLQRNDFALPYVNPSHNRGCEGECIGVRYF